MLADDLNLDAKTVAAFLKTAYVGETFAGELDAKPIAIVRAEHDGYAPRLRLSRNCQSEVWRCIDQNTGLDVVIKSILPSAFDSPEEAEACLRREAQILARLKGTATVLPLRLVVAGWSSYLALSYINGDPITTHCRIHSLDPAERIQLFCLCLRVLAQIHERGITHGDLKPEHFLIDQDVDNFPTLIDFGLGTELDHSRTFGHGQTLVGGTSQYMAPELVLDQTLPDPTQDVYSMGVILQQLMEGVDAALHEPKLQEIVRTATAVEPQDRYIDARSMLHAFDFLRVTQQVSYASLHCGGPVSQASKEFGVATYRLIAAVLKRLFGR